ncbi:hypothetical protein ACLQ2N_08270 [Streptomyces sp. DT224]|uniref:hypothetical protein n=1 Tax=Streptomyces sp. DT224 TaxID=3393426 RepID=UPI003CE9E09B
MRVRLTDGTRTVDISTEPREHLPLDQIEATALRLMQALPPRTTPHTYADPHPGDDTPVPFGYQPPADLDGTSLGSDLERAEPYIEPGRDDDEYDDQEHRP